MFDWYKKQDSWVLHTGGFSTTYAIGLSFVFLAYFLHPVVEEAFLRVRAYRAWCAVENRQTVEVTNYPLVEEVCGGRGKWDAARIVTVLLAAFSLASWGLELQLDLAYRDDLVTDLFLRPPPVWKTEDGTTWNVISPDELQIELDDQVANMFGNFSVGTANARYEINNKSDAIINGAVQLASWDTSVESLTNKLSYDDGNGFVHVRSDDCFEHDEQVDLYVEGDNDQWGTAVQCNSGPLKEDGTSTPPVLKINSTVGGIYFLVEESVTYPSFLYSVWKAINEASKNSTMLRHVFYISTSARLAEAVVTEIVHASRRDEGSREPTGGGSFALLREFSESNPTYRAIHLEQRASPFGEHPMGEQPTDRLSTIETIEKGVTLNTTALLCAIWVITLTLVGIAWSLLLRSRIGMDIYDRDELIRTVTSPASVHDKDHSSKMRIFVRKENGGNISVAVSDVEGDQNSCPQSLRRNETVAVNDPLPISSSNHAYDFGGTVLPPGSRTVWLEGVRTRRARVYPGREGNYRYPTSIALVASPVPSHVGPIAGTPVALLASPADAPPNGSLPAINPRLFESVNSLGESKGHDGDVEMGGARVKGEPEVEPYKECNPPSPSLSESRKTEVTDLSRLRFDSDSAATLNDPRSSSPKGGLTPGSASGYSARSRESTLGPEETKVDPHAHSEAKEETETEHGVHDGVHDRSDELV